MFCWSPGQVVSSYPEGVLFTAPWKCTAITLSIYQPTYLCSFSSPTHVLLIMYLFSLLPLPTLFICLILPVFTKISLFQFNPLPCSGRPHEAGTSLPAEDLCTVVLIKCFCMVR